MTPIHVDVHKYEIETKNQSKESKFICNII